MKNKNIVLAVLVSALLIFLVSCETKTGEPKVNPDTNKQTTATDNKNDDNNINKKDDEGNNNNNMEEGKKNDSLKVDKKEDKEKINLQEIKPDESGKVMVLMFHNFVETFKPTKSDNGEYTTTFAEFEKFLGVLYEKNYRLVNLADFIDGKVDVPAGKTPIVFTFDDGTKGQFNLIKKDGNLVVDSKCAVGIIEKFNKEKPDFGKKGTFYVNLGSDSFSGEGTEKERFKYLIDNGYEIGNHTYNHASLSKLDSNQIQMVLGKNQQKMETIIDGYKFKTLSLPFGISSKNNKELVIEGNYENTTYKNIGVMLVGAEPTLSPFHKKFSPLSMSRVRANGINSVLQDAGFWLNSSRRQPEFVSDGDVETVTVPKAKENDIDATKLGEKKLITY